MPSESPARLDRAFAASARVGVAHPRPLGPYAMNGWREAMGVDAKDITFLVDDLGEVSASWNLAKDYSGASLGVRSERFSMLVEDGEIKAFQLVDDASADAAWLLAQC